MQLPLVRLFHRSRTFNVAAASAVGTDIIRAVLDAIVTALLVSKIRHHGNAPRLPDGRTLIRQLRRTNLGNNRRRRAHIRVHRVKIVAKRFPDETVPLANVVLVATHIVKRLVDIAGKFVISDSGGHGEGSKKDGKVQGNDLHGRWLVVDRGDGFQLSVS
jgi:UDP-N-acetylglucosamine enolpyruvyl transferase